MKHLCDSNVFLALSLGNHPHHAVAVAWMDAYLAAFAVCAGMRFVTFDQGFEQFRKQGLDLLLLGTAVARH